MSIVKLEFDNKLKKTPIIVPLVSSSKQEAGDSYQDTNLTDKAQTSVFGIQVPLIQINSIVIDFDAVQYFSLKSTNKLPELNLIVEDRYELITNIDKVTNDNELRVQIIPRFDNTYKKIDLTFYITNIQVIGKSIKLSAAYKVSDLIKSQFKSFGEIDTYSIFKEIALETNLGFATNIAKLDDLRYIYCDHKSYYELLNNEINFANSTKHIIDWWVDFWDNINLVDIKERYNTIDPDKDLQVWISGQVDEVTVNTKLEPIKTDAVINNIPGMNNSELYFKSYKIQNNSGAQLSSGTDKVYSIYEDSNVEYKDYLIQDGDVKQDIFLKYDYMGENYGEYNYLLAKPLREAFLQKINTETIVVTLQSP